MTGWPAPTIATVATIVVLEVDAVTAVTAAATFKAPATATVGGTAPWQRQEDPGGVRVDAAGAALPPAELLCTALVVTGVVAVVVIPVFVAPHLRVMVLVARVVAWGTVGLAVVVRAVAAVGAIVPPIARPPLARATSSPTVLQLAIWVATGVVTVEEATAAPWLMMTTLALGPVSITLLMMKLGQERNLPNLFQLCIRRSRLVQ